MKRENWLQKNWQYLVLPVLITAVMLGVYAAKGVYPFGDVKVTYYDMTQDNVPAFTYLWDIMHGKASVLFDWNSGAGISWVASIAKFLFRPWNLFFYFVKRDGIWEAMSFYVILKMILSGLSLCFCLRKLYPKLDEKWLVTLPLLYVFSGYVLQYYSNIFFLDFVILLPLLHLSLVTMFEKGKSRWYILCLSYCLSLDIYFSFMMCLYLIFISFLYLMLRMEKEQRSQTVGRLIRSTFVCFVCTAWSTIPCALQMLSSIRSGTGDGLYITITSAFFCEYPDQKVYMLIGCELLYGIVLISLIQKKWKDRTFWYHVIKIALFILPIISEAVNLVWHIGSYACFPYRFAFMLSFGALDFCGWFLCQKEKIEFEFIKSRVLSCLINLIGIVLSGVAIWKYASLFIDNGIYKSQGKEKEPMFYFIIAFLILGAFWLFLLFQKQRRCYLFGTILILVQVSILSYGYFAPLDYGEVGEDIVEDSYKVKDLLGEKEDNLSRIKLYTTRISSNYPSLVDYPSLANRSYNLKQGYIDALKKLGYTFRKLTAYDSGGTIFTDALLNIKQTFSAYAIDSSAYQLLSEGEDFKVYQNRYTFPIGTVFSEEIMEEPDWQDEGKFSYQNKLANCMGLDDDLIEINELSKYRVRTVKNLPECDYILRIPVEGKKLLYLDAVDGVKGIIRVNGKLIYADSYIQEDADVFPNKLNNGLLCLGSFENATVTVQIHTMARSVNSFQIGQLSYDSLQKLVDKASSHAATNIVAKGTLFSCELDSDRDGYLLVPLQYQAGWSAKVNGRKTEITPVIQNGFIGIPVTEGQNQIELTFFPNGAKLGMLISAFGFVLAAMVYWWNARKKITDHLPGFILKGGNLLYYTVVTLAIILVYVWPIFLDIV